MNIKILSTLLFSSGILLISGCTTHAQKIAEPQQTTEKRDMLLNFCLQDTSAYDYTQEARAFCDCATTQAKQLFSATDWKIFENLEQGSNAKPNLHTTEQLAQFDHNVNAVLVTCPYSAK